VTTLAAAVDAVDKLWTIDTMPDAPFLEAGDELVEISARFPEHIYAPTQETIPAKIRVRRAVAGTAAAIHAQGVTLTPVYPESSGGGQQTVRLLGPFSVLATDSVELSTNGRYFGEVISAETVIVSVWCEVVQRMATGAAGYFDVMLAEPASGPTSIIIRAPQDGISLVGGEPTYRQPADEPGLIKTMPITARVDVQLYVYWNLSGTPSADGEMLLYALIAESA
jgi:hypothetical protein